MRTSLFQAAVGLTAFLIPVTCAAARSESKVDKFRALSRASGGVVKLDSALYDEITDGPRDYSVSVVLTAMAPQFKCQPCQ